MLDTLGKGSAARNRNHTSQQNLDPQKIIMRGKIILEEHVCMPEDDPVEKLRFASRNSEALAKALLEIHGSRLDEMNANGVEMAIMSQNPPGAQGIRDPTAAEAYAVRSNNYIASLVDEAPERFAAFAGVSMHDPRVAASELTRCVKELGMVGVMLHDAQEYLDANGVVKEQFYDDAKYDTFWATVQSLNVPVYLHPKPPIPQEFLRLYQSRPWLVGPTFSFTVDSSFHALALCTGGVFDRFPQLQMILGHMGELLLGQLGRIDHWLEKRDRGRGLPAQKTLREYLEKNVSITTAGYFCTPPLLNAVTEIGVDRILFSVDTPYENITEGSTWLDMLPINQASIEKIGRTNALKLFPQLQARLRSSDVKALQGDRKSVLFTPNPGFEMLEK